MFLQILAAGTTMGLIYAVVAFGFQIVARGSNIFNFAHGEFVAIATLIYFSLAATFGIPPIAAVILTVLAVMLVSLAVERLMLAPVRVREPLIVAILTVGIGTLLRGVMILVWGHDVLFAPPFIIEAAQLDEIVEKFAAALETTLAAAAVAA